MNICFYLSSCLMLWVTEDRGELHLVKDLVQRSWTPRHHAPCENCEVNRSSEDWHWSQKSQNNSDTLRQKKRISANHSLIGLEISQLDCGRIWQVLTRAVIEHRISTDKRMDEFLLNIWGLLTSPTKKTIVWQSKNVNECHEKNINQNCLSSE